MAYLMRMYSLYTVFFIKKIKQLNIIAVLVLLKELKDSFRFLSIISLRKIPNNISSKSRF